MRPPFNDCLSHVSTSCRAIVRLIAFVVVHKERMVRLGQGCDLTIFARLFYDTAKKVRVWQEEASVRAIQLHMGVPMRPNIP